MVIYYLAAVCPQKYYEILYPNGAVSPAYTFNKLLAEGLGFIEEIEVNCIVPKVVIDKLGVYQTSEKENNINYIFVENRFKRAGYLGFLYSCMKLIREKSKSEKIILICDALSINFSILCIMMKIFYKYSNIAIVTDFPQYLGEKDKRTIGKIKDKFVMWLMRRYDRYILLTSEMGKIINAKLRPQCIIEGVCDTSAHNIFENKDGIKICMYAGSLQIEYGIEILVKSFLKANVANAQLHIYGDGNYREQLEKICEKYSQIVYCGVCPKKVIEEKEREATLLVNPRTSDGEYTKYSFPSKTMEYMLSGTPVVMTRLPGLPQEYYKYLFLFEEETVDGYAQTLKVLLEMDPSELQRRGMAAQRFVLDNKNKEIQAKKIVKELELLL
mgnify:FL=1